MLMCFERFDDSDKARSQYKHLNGFLPLCVRLWIVSARSAIANAFPHPGGSRARRGLRKSSERQVSDPKCILSKPAFNWWMSAAYAVHTAKRRRFGEVPTTLFVYPRILQ